MAVGVSDIGVAPSAPNTIYVATGDAESGGFFGQNFSFSIGILKSTDGGASWKQTGLQAPQSNTLLINRLLVHPTDPNTVYMGSNAGVYKTVDGGTNWTQISAEICRDLEFKPTDPTILYASIINSGVYSIRKYTVASGQWSRQLEFAQNEVARIALTTSKGNASYVYAVVAGADMGFHSFWKTTNEGTTWTKISDKSKTPNLLSFEFDGSTAGGQGMYDLAVTADPVDPKTVYVGGVNIWKSTDGGSKWNLLADWTGYYAPWVHADHHYLDFSPNGTLFSANDGGLQKSSNYGTNWTDISNGLAVMQFYRLATSKTDADFIIAGAQDNGTNKLNGGVWQNIQGGDGMECLIDYSDAKYIYASLYYGELTRSVDGGNTFTQMFDPKKVNEQGGWVTPMIMHPSDPKILFAGLHNIWKTTDRGVNWGPISNFAGNGNFRALTIAPSNPNYIYAAAYNQLVQSTNGGTSWNITYTAEVQISYIVVDPTKPDRIWLALSGFKDGSKVLKIDNGTLTNVSGTLPNVPVNCIVYQNNSVERLYIGTDIGVFTRDKSSKDWELFNDGLPPVVINELEIHYG
ncbi:MAG: hypothetical protein WCL00_14725, partial [Bacteroidota bacterium]